MIPRWCKFCFCSWLSREKPNCPCFRLKSWHSRDFVENHDLNMACDWLKSFSRMIMARRALLRDQSRSVLPLRSANLESCGGKNCTRAPWTIPFKLAKTSSFQSARTDKWKRTSFFNFLSTKKGTQNTIEYFNWNLLWKSRCDDTQDSFAMQ